MERVKVEHVVLTMSHQQATMTPLQSLAAGVAAGGVESFVTVSVFHPPYSPGTELIQIRHA
jgi:hypothetical protein